MQPEWLETDPFSRQFGYYHILPLTAPEVVEWPDFDVPPSTLSNTTHPCQIRIGDYNVRLPFCSKGTLHP